MIIHPDSHLDHGLTAEHIAYIADRFAARNSSFAETFVLPDTLPGAPCALYGPVMGDAPITDGDVNMRQRGERPGLSRVVSYPVRPSRRVTVIAGPHDGHPCVLYTAYGGPLAPREPSDIHADSFAAAESRAFWAQHALAVGVR